MDHTRGSFSPTAPHKEGVSVPTEEEVVHIFGCILLV
ncbi:hypothetical protein FKM82_024501 [Ascaphus truei]